MASFSGYFFGLSISLPAFSKAIETVLVRVNGSSQGEFDYSGQAKQYVTEVGKAVAATTTAGTASVRSSAT